MAGAQLHDSFAATGGFTRLPLMLVNPSIGINARLSEWANASPSRSADWPSNSTTRSDRATLPPLTRG